MRGQRLIRTLAGDRPALGASLHIADPAVVEIAGIAGFDWVSIAIEHATLDLGDLAALQLAADVRDVTTLIHVADADDPRILPLLNTGVGGIVLAHAVTAAQVEQLVQIARFPPVGERGAHRAVRSAEYGVGSYADYVASIDRSVIVGIAIEDVAGVENAAELVAVPGIDVAFVGLQDLSQSLGCPGDYRHADIREALARVVEAAAPHGTAIAAGLYDYEARELADLGVRMMAASLDYSALLGAFSAEVARARDSLA